MACWKWVGRQEADIAGHIRVLTSTSTGLDRLVISQLERRLLRRTLLIVLFRLLLTPMTGRFLWMVGLVGRLVARLPYITHLPILFHLPAHRHILVGLVRWAATSTDGLPKFISA